MDKEKIKNKARAAMLRATILAAAGTGIAQSAAAQEKNADDNKHKIEMTASVGMDDLEGAFADFAAEAEKAYAGFAEEKAAEFGDFAGESAAAFDDFAGESVTKYNGFTEEGAAKVGENEKAAARAPRQAPEEIKGDVHTARDKNGTVKYAFTDKGLLFEADLSVNVARLTPGITRDKNGTYHCGSSKGTAYNAVLMSEQHRLQTLVARQIICGDLQKRQQEGENLGDREQNFIKSHTEQMKKAGLGINPKTGALQRTDGNVYNPLKMSGMSR